MNILILPGNLKVNEPWLEGMDKVLRENNRVIAHKYTHWKSKEELLNIDSELELLREKLHKINEYIIVAKSAGILVAAKGIYDKVLDPQLCIFIGTPILWANEHKFSISKWIRKLKVPILFIQQKDDPFGNLKLLKKFVKENVTVDFKLISIVGNDHWYGEFDSLKTKIGEFLTKESENL